ncbi:hypothetical protein [Sphingobacterium tabacisoli]|uniref:Natural product n=1 Tax=Sphingobacterium tabacisoli TaxID=2044855 RepID=A0ABW5L0L1_9SPHI|nr:hypothetical protein [Sphingobacterium tabacisoli]
MKKISFKNLDNLGIEKMSREKLKSVKGGETVSLFSSCMAYCNCPAGYVQTGSQYIVGIDCEMGSMCMAKDYFGVKCEGISGAELNCSDKVQQYCIPLED